MIFGEITVRIKIEDCNTYQSPEDDLKQYANNGGYSRHRQSARLYLSSLSEGRRRRTWCRPIRANIRLHRLLGSRPLFVCFLRSPRTRKSIEKLAAAFPLFFPLPLSLSCQCCFFLLSLAVFLISLCSTKLSDCLPHQ